MEFLVIGGLFIGLGFFIKAFPYFGSYTIDDLFNMDIEKFSTAFGYLLITLGSVMAVVLTFFQWLEWYDAVRYMMFGCIITMIVGLVVLNIIYTIKKKE